MEHLCRYIARPPISTDRLTLDERGRILYRLRHPYRDGTTHIVFTPTSFLERLCALIPRPCKHLLTYHGVLAPASSWRPEIIPRGAFESVPGTSRPTTRTSLERRLRWAELIRRVFDADVLHCECGARRRVIVARMLRPGRALGGRCALGRKGWRLASSAHIGAWRSI